MYGAVGSCLPRALAPGWLLAAKSEERRTIRNALNEELSKMNEHQYPNHVNGEYYGGNPYDSRDYDDESAVPSSSSYSYPKNAHTSYYYSVPHSTASNNYNMKDSPTESRHRNRASYSSSNYNNNGRGRGSTISSYSSIIPKRMKRHMKQYYKMSEKNNHLYVGTTSAILVILLCHVIFSKRKKLRKSEDEDDDDEPATTWQESFIDFFDSINVIGFIQTTSQKITQFLSLVWHFVSMTLLTTTSDHEDLYYSGESIVGNDGDQSNNISDGFDQSYHETNESSSFNDKGGKIQPKYDDMPGLVDITTIQHQNQLSATHSTQQEIHNREHTQLSHNFSPDFELEPAFLNPDDFPDGWLTYDPNTNSCVVYRQHHHDHHRNLSSVHHRHHTTLQQQQQHINHDETNEEKKSEAPALHIHNVTNPPVHDAMEKHSHPQSIILE